MRFTVAAMILIGAHAQSSASASDTGVLHNVHRSIKKRHLATNETSSHHEEEEWAEGKGDAHHAGNRTNGHINKNVTALSQQDVQSSLEKEEGEDPLFGCPKEDIVDCDSGVLKSSDSHPPTCEAACMGECCVGTGACDGFTGRVCKDGNSCVGQDACKDATIGLVVGGCRGDPSAARGVCEYAKIEKGVIRGCIGELACYDAGDNGYVGRIKDGCVGGSACQFLGEGYYGGGYVGFVDNSCVGDQSCLNSGSSYDTDYNGRVGFIRNACKGKGSCQGAGRDGSVGFIENSCTELSACFYTGAFTDQGIGSIEHSCHGEDSCESAARDRGEITSIKWSCKGQSSCAYTARYGGYIDGINKACLGDSACFEAAKYGGSIDGISKACLSDFSCAFAAGTKVGDSGGGSIDSGIKNCVCDTCAGALDDTSLPDECGDKLDFGDLFNELNDIIKSKIDP